MEATKTRLGERIKELLEKQRMSQAKLADHVGVDPAVISKFVNGNHSVLSKKVVELIAETLGFEILEELTNGTDWAPPNAATKGWGKGMLYHPERLTLALRVKGISANQLCKEVGITTAQISEWARHNYKPSVSTTEKLGKFFGVPPKWFFGEGEDNLIGSPVALSPQRTPLSTQGDQEWSVLFVPTNSLTMVTGMAKAVGIQCKTMDVSGFLRGVSSINSQAFTICEQSLKFICITLANFVRNRVPARLSA